MSDAPAGYVTVQDAAKKLNRSAEQVRRYLRAGRLEGMRVGGQWFIQEEALVYLSKPGLSGDTPQGQGEVTGLRMDNVLRVRRAAIQRIKERRAAIRTRWEGEGTAVDAVAIVRELREER